MADRGIICYNRNTSSPIATGFTVISAPIKKPDRTLAQDYPKPFPVRIHSPAPRAGIYHGMVLDCIGIEADSRMYLVPLPAIGDRPSYLGKFPEHHIILIGEAEARGDYEEF
jgi:hypothetical protein